MGAEEWVVGGRMDISGVYRFRSLMKQYKKAKNHAVFCFAGKRFFFYIYDVITWEKISKRSSKYYCDHTFTLLPFILLY
jgi:hypothetical protein